MGTNRSWTKPVASLVCLIVIMLLALSRQVNSYGPIEAPLQPLFKALANSKVSASIELSGSCGAQLPRLPNMQRPGNANGTALDVAREMLAVDREVRVVADRDGTIRIKQSGIEDDVLKLTIHHIKFGGPHPDGADYSPSLVLVPVMAAPEVSAFMKSHDAEWRLPLWSVSTGGVTPPSFPHLSGSLDNVTVSQVFDYALKIFPGIWVYQNCPSHNGKKRSVYVHFFLNPYSKYRPQARHLPSSENEHDLVN